MKCTGWALACLLYGHSIDCSSAQEMDERQQQAAKYLYEQHATSVRKSIDTKVQTLLGVGEKRNNRALTQEEIRIGRAFVIEIEYQLLIDLMICGEKLIKERRVGENFSEPELQSCYEERKNKSEEMFRFWWDYASLDSQNLVLTRCKAKSRLLQKEIRYPPYSFMIESDGEAPKAVDGTAFMECVRARL